MQQPARVGVPEEGTVASETVGERGHRRVPRMYRATKVSEMYTSAIVWSSHLCDMLDEVGRAQVSSV